MTRSGSVYMTPHAFTEQYGSQLRQALPDLVDLPMMKLHMTAGMANGLNWGESLQYALQQRRTISAIRAEVCVRRPGSLSDDLPAGIVAD